MIRPEPLYFLLTLLLSAASVCAQEDYYSRDNILKFSESLFADGDYELAAGEFLRVAAQTPEAALRDSLWYKVAASYINLQKPAIARRYLGRISTDSSLPDLRQKAGSMALFSYYLEKKYDSAVILAGRIPGSFSSGTVARNNAVIAAASLLKQHHWKEAVASCEAMAAGAPEDTVAAELLSLGRDGMNIRLKNAPAAAAMSAIIPGSGKVYAHRGWDGLFSLLIIGTSVWQSYEGYRKDGPVSVRCIGFGALGAAFYCGNIYGSYTAARLYNRAQSQSIADRVRINFSW